MYGARGQLFLPIDIAVKIGKEEPIYKLAAICDELDYSALRGAYIRKYRKYDPAMLFEIVVFGYMNGKYSSREIEDACRHDIRFMWLLQGSPVPDHATIAHFQNERLSEVMEELFYQLVAKLAEMEEIQFENLFVDGTKIEANANRYTFVWARAVQKQMNKAYARLDRELPVIAAKYGISETASLEEVLEIMTGIVRMTGIPFVQGKGHWKTDLQRDYERLARYGEQIQRYKESLGRCGKRKSYSKTDPDATFMRMKEDHMKNGQLKPGYNVQIGVESEYIVGVGLFPNPTDTTTLIPFLERVKGGCGKKYRNIIADAGYASEENYTYLEEAGQNAYIKPRDYEVSKTKKFKSNPYRVENLIYDEIGDTYRCPEGKKLLFSYEGKDRTESGYMTRRRHYVCEDCSGCLHREKCFKGKDENRKISVSRTYARQTKEAVRRITTDEGILLRMNRSIQVEGAFGVLKEDYAFRRFLTRGKRKTETQFFLLAFAFNIQKLHNRLCSGRFNSALFEKMIA